METERKKKRRKRVNNKNRINENRVWAYKKKSFTVLMVPGKPRSPHFPGGFEVPAFLHASPRAAWRERALRDHVSRPLIIGVSHYSRRKGCSKCYFPPGAF